MMLSAERMYALTKFVCADKERAKKLLALKPEDAAQQINAFGYEYTADEIRDYARAMLPHIAGHAYFEDELDETTGGMGTDLDVEEFKILRILKSIQKN